jgi:hypothetical protein
LQILKFYQKLATGTEWFCKYQSFNQLTLNISLVEKYHLVKDNVKIIVISMFLILMLSGTVLSSALVGTSHAQPTTTTFPKDNRPDPNQLVNQGVRCGPPKDNPNANAICQNTTVPFAIPSTGVALAQQTNDVLTGLSIGNDGALYVTFKVGIGKWNTVGISPKGIFQPRSNIAIAKQTDSILTALAIGKDGALRVSWVVGTGKWNGPVPISPIGMFYPGADISMIKQTNDRLTAWAVGKNGWIYQAWVDGTGQWNKPAGRPIFVCCQSHYTDQFGDQRSGPYMGFDGNRYSIAAHKLPNGMLAVLIVDVVGELKMVPIVGPCNVDRCENIKEQYMKIKGWPYPIPTIIGPWKLFPVGAGTAVAQQADNLVTALTIGNDGSLRVTWITGDGKWQGPVGISPPNTFPRGAPIAMTKQTKDVLTALAVGNNGALQVSWVVGTGKWQGPVGISPPNMFSPGAGIAMTYFSGASALEALTVGKDGGLYVSWVVGTGKWNGPVKIY